MIYMTWKYVYKWWAVTHLTRRFCNCRVRRNPEVLRSLNAKFKERAIWFSWIIHTWWK
jgi:hypothetical protein